MLLNQSENLHLMVVTQTGNRVFIEFKTQEVEFPTGSRNSAIDYFDYIVKDRPTSEWCIRSITNLPSEEAISDYEFKAKFSNSSLFTPFPCLRS